MQQKMDCEFDVVDRIRRSGLFYKYIESVCSLILAIVLKFLTPLL